MRIRICVSDEEYAGQGRIAVGEESSENGEVYEVPDETGARWLQAYDQWRVVEAEIDGALARIELERSMALRAEARKMNKVMNWFDEHHRRLREEPGYSWPHDTVVIDGVSYGVRNRL